MRTLMGAATLTALLLATAGCDRRTVPVATVANVRLEDIYGLYKAHIEKMKRPPTKLSQLEPWEPLYVNGYAAANEGQIVVVWDQPLTAAAAILAYERDTPDSGGYVLFQDGSIRQITAVEFEAAPKPVKR
jgi:hypothetical protein